MADVGFHSRWRKGTAGERTTWAAGASTFVPWRWYDTGTNGLLVCDGSNWSGTAYTSGAVLTVPATGTAALLGTANVFTAEQTINVNSATALLVEQDGVHDNVLIVDTTNGVVAIGGAGTAETKLKVYETYTTTSGTKYGADIQLVMNPSGGSTSVGYALRSLNTLQGTEAVTGLQVSNTANLTISGAGTYGTVSGYWSNVKVDNAVAATVTTFRGFTLSAFDAEDATVTTAEGMRVNMVGVDGGAVTTSRGIYIAEGTVGGGSITHQYGIQIGDITAAATNNYAILTGTGKVKFGDEVELDGDLNHDGTNVGFYGTAPVSQRLKADYNNWAAFGDVVDALVALGLFDAA